LLAGLLSARAQAPAPGPAPTNAPAGAAPAYSLAQFGSLATPALADAAFSNAQRQLIGAGGGLLLIPAEAPAGWTPRNNGQGIWRNPPPPAPSNKSWGKGPGVTVIDCRTGTLRIAPPQVTGLDISRTLDLAKGTSLPHWDIIPLVTLKNTLLTGSPESHSGLIRADTWSHNENQTFDVMLWRHNYSQGDNYLFDGKIEYMGDGHSATGQANNAIYSASANSDAALFRGVVESWEPAAGELVYKPGAKADTLGSGRPLINLNPAKWITNGSACVYNSGAILGWGGAVQSADAPWTSNVVGRYFAIDEPGEYVPGGDTVRRWWLITGFAGLTNGLKSLSFQRHWWGAKDGHSIGRLYRADHYTADPLNPRPLRYIIAPGVNVYDVSEGVSSPAVNPDGVPRRLRLAPSPFAGTAVDFAAGDAVEQAIGPDPFKPIPFRSWLWDDVPGIFPAPVFDIANRGVMRHAVLAVGGGSGSAAADRAARHDRNPPFNALVQVNAASHTGLRFEADTAGSALLFMQPRLANGQPQAIEWSGNVPARLQVRPDGSLLAGGASPLGLAGGSVSSPGGLSGGASRTANLRGLAESVPEGATRVSVKFQTKELDGGYGVIALSSWSAACAVTEQSAEGFNAEFDRPAPKGAAIRWVLIR
jgi:hypothetical protein